MEIENKIETNEEVVPEVISGDAELMANASLLDLNNLQANATNSSLRDDEWVKIDDMIIKTAEETMNGIKDLIEYGLVVQNGGLGTTIHEYETEGDMTDASVNMSGMTNTNEDALEFGIEGVPVPIIGKGFKISHRRLDASRKRGEPIDTSTTRIAIKKITEKLETILFKGANVNVDGKSLYGYTTLPQRTEVTILGDWATTPANIETDIVTLLAAADAINRRGPFMIYVSVADFSSMRKRVSTTGDVIQTWYNAMVQQFSQIIDIKPTKDLDVNNIVMVQMDADTVDLSVGSEQKVLELNKKFLETEMLAFVAMAPRCKYDGNDTSGIFHGTKA